MNIITLSNITKEYVNGDLVTPVLHAINLEIKQGEFVAIMGPSGSGKSTLMHILGFLDRPSSGTYLFEGSDVVGFDDEVLASIRNKRIGFVFQSFNLLARTTVLENVALPLSYDKDVKDRITPATRALESVGLQNRLHYLPNQISGGQKQRVAIARALVNNPSVLFADEPTGNLDSKSGKTVMGIIQRLHDEGRTIILVTHDRAVALHADRIITIRDGHIESDEQVKDKIRVTITDDEV